MSVINIFPIKIYKTTFHGYKDVLNNLEPRLDRYRTEYSEDMSCIPCDDVYYNIIHNLAFDRGNINKYPELESAVQLIEEHAKLYWKELGYHDRLIPKVRLLLLGMSYENGFLMDHLHSPYPLNATLYLKIKPGHGKLVLTNPNDAILLSQPIGDSFSDHSYAVEVEEGDIVIFPGYIRHKFTRNTIKDERLCLAFSIGCEGVDLRRLWGEIE